MSTKNTKQDVVITIIHGTWAITAEWTDGRTELGKKVKRQLLSYFSNADIKRFQWGGNNSHTSRSKAANELVGNLDSQVERFPKAKQLFVIKKQHFQT